MIHKNFRHTSTKMDALEMTTEMKKAENIKYQTYEMLQRVKRLSERN